MQWIGALLIVAVTTWIGFEWSSRLTNRPKHIRQLKSALQILEAEILYSQLPLREVFRTIGKQIPNPTGNFFTDLSGFMDTKEKNLYLIFEKELSRYMARSSLGKNEGEIIKQFGKTLGQHDYTQQQKQIQLAITHLERELEEARDAQFKYAKMAKSLGFLTGIFVVLILI